MKIMACEEIQKVKFYNVVLSFLLLCLILAFPGGALGADEMSLDEYVSVSTADESSTLDRTSRVITSTAEVTITNTSDQSIKFPFHAVININGTDYQDVTMPDALGGNGSGPYGRYYYEWTGAGPDQIASNFGKEECLDNCPDMDKDGDVDGIDFALASMGGSLEPGKSLKFMIRFQRPAGINFTYNIHCLGVLSQENDIPVANAGEDRTITLEPGQDEITINLDGSGSEDSDGSIVSYTWSGTPDPDDVVQPSVTLGEGTYVFTLVVTDNLGALSIPDQVTIIVQRAGATEIHPPVLSLGETSYTVDEGSTLSFQVSASDPDGDTVAISAAPLLENAEFASTPSASPTGTFTFRPDFDQQGIYLVQFVARDPMGLTDAGTVRITVNNVNRPPTLTVPETVEVEEGSLVTIPVKASDPDGEILALSASPLPEHALFIPATGSITFGPDFDQAGTYDITCSATDGRDEVSAVIHVTVNDVTQGSGEGNRLILKVNPAESPTLLDTARISGTVNSNENPNVSQLTSAVVTALSPSSAGQGQTLDVTITGKASDEFATHFSQGTTQVNFGQGITVNSVTVHDEADLIANITISPNASVGPKVVTITTENETAVSIAAFNVTPGHSTIQGTLVDKDTGQPISGATVTIQGTAFSSVTDENGFFTLSDVLCGKQTLIITSRDHQLLTLPFEISPSTSMALGKLESRSTVYDPHNPSPASIFSVMGRGAGDTTGNVIAEELEELIIDTITLVGDTESGILDEYGEQLNPNYTEEFGFVNLTYNGVEKLAERMESGSTVPLHDLFFVFNFGFEWSEGHPQTLDEWIEMLQQSINRAWADPSNPDSYMAIVMFGKGGHISPDPPQISPYTKLNMLQSYLFTTGLWTYILTRDDENRACPSRFWRNAFEGKNNYITGNLIHSQLSMQQWIMGMALPVYTKLAASCPLFQELSTTYYVLRLSTLLPEPPEIINAVPVQQPDTTYHVNVRFRHPLWKNGMGPEDGGYLLTLFRFEPDSNGKRVAVASGSFDEVALNNEELQLVDPNPPPGFVYYSLTLSKLGKLSLTPDQINRIKPFWTSPLTGVDPIAIINTIKVLTSDYSKSVTVAVGPPELTKIIDELEVSNNNGEVFYMDTSEQKIFRILDRGAGPTLFFTQTGFKEPGPIGLAIDKDGAIYTENTASDAQFGGRIFRFDQSSTSSPQRSFVGSVNYFSRLLMFAHPVSAGPMVIGPDDKLYIVDNLSREILAVPVREDWDPYRRVGQFFAKIPDAVQGRTFDMEMDKKGNLYMLYMGVDIPPVPELNAGPSYFLDTPKGGIRPNTQIPVISDGLITKYGRIKMEVTVNMVDEDHHPLPNEQVIFSCDNSAIAHFDQYSVFTDINGVAKNILNIEITPNYRDTTNAVTIFATVPDTGDQLEKRIPVTDNLQVVLDRYYQEIPIGIILRDGSYYTSPFGIFSAPGVVNNIMQASYALTFSNSPDGEARNQELANFVCGGYQAQVLSFLTKIQTSPADAYLLNGLDFGPIQAFWSGHHAAIIYVHGEDYSKGWVLDPWMTQTPTVTPWEEWNEQMLFTGAPDSVYDKIYPLTGAEHYPDNIPPVTPEKPSSIIIVDVPGDTWGVEPDIVINSHDPIYINHEGHTYSRQKDSFIHITRQHDVVIGMDEGNHELHLIPPADGNMTVTLWYPGARKVVYENVPVHDSNPVHLTIDPDNPNQPIQDETGWKFEPTEQAATQPVISHVEPKAGRPGDTIDIEITGVGTHFVSESSKLIFGDGVKANSLVVNGPTSAVANITINEDIDTEYVAFSMITNDERALSLERLTIIFPEN